MTLDELNPGQSAVIRKVDAEKPLRHRLLDMGLTRGIRVELLKSAPMGDPLEYKVRDYHLSLRKSEARRIEVEL